MDPVADLLIRIKNAYLAHKKALSFPHSKLGEEVVKLLVSHAFVKKYRLSGKGSRKEIEVDLRYKNSKPAITGLKRLSKPGCRLYSRADKLPWGRSSRSLIIISTSKGLMSQRLAVTRKIGGEIMAEIW